jgi:hypothetical protein
LLFFIWFLVFEFCYFFFGSWYLNFVIFYLVLFSSSPIEIKRLFRISRRPLLKTLTGRMVNHLHVGADGFTFFGNIPSPPSDATPTCQDSAFALLPYTQYKTPAKTTV